MSNPTRVLIIHGVDQLAAELEAGTELSFKGDEGDAMVVCSDRSTYEVKVRPPSDDGLARVQDELQSCS